MASSDDAEDAAAAFNALRAEVGVLRQDIAHVRGEMRAIKAPDVTPTLVAMQASLDAISAHPAMQLTPTRITREVEAATQTEIFNLQKVTAAMQRATTAAEQFLQQSIDLHLDRRQRVCLFLYGMCAGVLAYLVFGDVLYSHAPENWRLPEKAATHILHMTPWDAGQRLMQYGNIEEYERLAAASRAFGDQNAIVLKCEDLATKLNKPQKCAITVKPLK